MLRNLNTHSNCLIFNSNCTQTWLTKTTFWQPGFREILEQVCTILQKTIRVEGYEYWAPDRIRVLSDRQRGRVVRDRDQGEAALLRLANPAVD